MDPNYNEALQRLSDLFERTKETSLREPAAVSLATVNEHGRPTVRLVLLRGFDERGFVFYTNSESDKAKHLAARPFAALCFYCDPLREQVRIEGPVEQISAGEADAYWAGRPRESKIGAWASLQSRPLDSRETLEKRFADVDRRFAGREIPRPDFWNGYRVVPDRIEFWQSRAARLHDRTVYEKRGETWTVRLLFP